MDVLKYKTVTGTDGNNTVNTGLSLAQIIKISRNGEQKDYAGLVAASTLNGTNWIYISTFKRIAFGPSYPFVGDEDIHIIYKESI